MKLSTSLAGVVFLLTACGQPAAENSELSSERFSINVLGIEMGSCNQDELRRFVAGEHVPPISNKLPKDQQTELRQKFGRVIHISTERTAEALKSEAGAEVRSILKAIFPPSYKEEFVNEAFKQSIADSQFTLLEFVSLYPSQELKVNGLAFVGKKDKLEAALLKLEQQFRN
ncbi:MAG: hypothetical protein RLZZ488_745 [Pseudomonadota bacterium]|jgi:hypothetical protein